MVKTGQSRQGRGVLVNGRAGRSGGFLFVTLDGRVWNRFVTIETNLFCLRALLIAATPSFR